jgi:hypothetical protein
MNLRAVRLVCRYTVGLWEGRRGCRLARALGLQLTVWVTCGCQLCMHPNLPDLASGGRYDRDFLGPLDSKKLPLFQRWNFQKKMELPKMHLFVEVLWNLFATSTPSVCHRAGNIVPGSAPARSEGQVPRSVGGPGGPPLASHCMSSPARAVISRSLKLIAETARLKSNGLLLQHKAYCLAEDAVGHEKASQGWRR